MYVKPYFFQRRQKVSFKQVKNVQTKEKSRNTGFNEWLEFSSASIYFYFESNVRNFRFDKTKGKDK